MHFGPTSPIIVSAAIDEFLAVTEEREPSKPIDDPRYDKRDGERSVTSETLLGRRRQLSIIHNGERYTLRITANDKLILTK